MIVYVSAIQEEMLCGIYSYLVPDIYVTGILLTTMGSSLFPQHEDYWLSNFPLEVSDITNSVPIDQFKVYLQHRIAPNNQGR